MRGCLVPPPGLRVMLPPPELVPRRSLPCRSVGVVPRLQALLHAMEISVLARHEVSEGNTIEPNRGMFLQWAASALGPRRPRQQEERAREPGCGANKARGPTSRSRAPGTYGFNAAAKPGAGPGPGLLAARGRPAARARGFASPLRGLMRYR